LTVIDDNGDSNMVSTTVTVGSSSTLSEETQGFIVDNVLFVFIAIAIVSIIAVCVLFWRCRRE